MVYRINYLKGSSSYQEANSIVANVDNRSGLVAKALLRLSNII